MAAVFERAVTRIGQRRPVQHFGGQSPPTHHGGNKAGYRLPSAPQVIIWQEPPAQLVEHKAPTMQAADFDDIILFFFAASDGATEITMTAAAMAPASRTFAMDFMVV